VLEAVELTQALAVQIRAVVAAQTRKRTCR
jgi:hypothetical protein